MAGPVRCATCDRRITEADDIITLSFGREEDDGVPALRDARETLYFCPHHQPGDGGPDSFIMDRVVVPSGVNFSIRMR